MKIREGVEWFASRIENVLKENDDKDGWEDFWQAGFQKLNEEISEVWELVHKECSKCGGVHGTQVESIEYLSEYDSIEDFIDECADAAAVLMMLATQAGKKKNIYTGKLK